MKLPAGLLRDLPQLQSLGLTCANHSLTHHDLGMGLLACELGRGNLPCLGITGSMGLSQVRSGACCLFSW